MTVWTLQHRISRQLLLWGAFSTLGGTALLVGGFPPLWRGIGLQGVAWGVIDAGIALFGRAQMRRRRANLPSPDAPEVTARETRKLRRLLLVNAGLDVLYLAGGAALALSFGSTDPFARGNGVGIIVQGAFLLLFDLFYAGRTGHILAHDLSQTA